MLLAALLALAAYQAPAVADDWGLTRPGSSAGRRARAKGAPSARKKPAAKSERAASGAGRAARYLKVLRTDPLDRFAFERLVDHYRKRDGDLEGLARELSEQAQQADGDAIVLTLLRAQVDAARGQTEQARAEFEDACELQPSRAAAWIARGRFELDQGERQQAERFFERALEHSDAARVRSELLRELGELALERQDFETAERRYAALAASGKPGIYQRTRYARALAERGHHGRAADAYEQAVASLRGDRRALPPVLLELARARLDADEPERALEALGRARRTTAAGSGLRRAVDELRVEVYRRRGQLQSLADELAADNDASAEGQGLLARIYDELGDHGAALGAIRRALSRKPRAVELRTRAIRILTRQGDLKAAIAEYRQLLRVAPGDATHALELAQLLMESGQRPEALRLLSSTARRFQRDVETQRTLLELYARWGEERAATETLRRLTQLDRADPSHLRALGAQLLERGEREAALATWQRMVGLGKDRAAARAALAETYMDHDMPEQALEQWRLALRSEPRHPHYLRGLAEVQERLRQTAEAARTWERVLSLVEGDRQLEREAHERLTRLWATTGELGPRKTELERLFGWPPEHHQGAEPDLAAGRFLAEIYRVMGRGRGRLRGDPRFRAAAEAVWARLVELDPGDIPSLLSLERSRAIRGDLAGATEVLERLVKVDPSGARRYLARMAEHALSQYRDGDALKYAERSLALNPEDAAGQRRLGDLYRARGEDARAIDAYERAITLDPRAHDVHFDLAELYLSRGEQQRVVALLERVARASPDQELVRRAARTLLQLQQGRGRLRALEDLLLPLALGHPQRVVYRKLLVELFEARARPLMAQAQGHGKGAEQAREALRTLGTRAIQPLLEALSGRDPEQQRIAVDLLGHLQNAHAVGPLLALAEREGDADLRRRALLSVGGLASDAHAARLSLLVSSPERRLRDAAIWALSQVEGPNARDHMLQRVQDAAPTVRAYALLGIGRNRGTGRTPEVLLRAAREDRHPGVRAAALLGLALHGDPEHAATLVAALEAERSPVIEMALVALGALADRASSREVAAQLYHGDAEVRRAAAWALRSLAAGVAPLPRQWPSPDEHLNIRRWITAITEHEPAADEGRSLELFEEELRDATAAALKGPIPTIALALELLGGEGALPIADDNAALSRVRMALSQQLSSLVEHPEPGVRAAALRRMASARDPAAAAQKALGDDDGRVRGAALEALSTVGEPDGSAGEALSEIALSDRRWWMRARALKALAASAQAADVDAVARVLEGDSYAFVRLAAVEALVDIAARVQCAESAGSSARACLPEAALKALRTARSDPEAAVREAARSALLRLVPSARN